MGDDHRSPFERFCQVLARNDLSTMQYAQVLGTVIDEAYSIEPEQTRKAIACLLSALFAKAASCPDLHSKGCSVSNATDASLNYLLASGAVVLKASDQPVYFSTLTSLLMEMSHKPSIRTYDGLAFLFFLLRSCELGRHLTSNAALHFQDGCNDGLLVAIQYLCFNTIPACERLLSLIASNPCLLSSSDYGYCEFDLLCLLGSLMPNYPAECDQLSTIIASVHLSTERKLQFCLRFVSGCAENEALAFFLFSPAVVHFFSSLATTNPDQAASFFRAVCSLKAEDASYRLTLLIWTLAHGLDSAVSSDPTGRLAPLCALKDRLVSSPDSIPALCRLDHKKRVHFLKRLGATFEAHPDASTHLANCQYLCVHAMIYFSDNYNHFNDYHAAFYTFLRKAGQPSPLTERTRTAYIEFKQFLHQSTRHVGEERRHNFLKIAELIDNYTCSSTDSIALGNALNLLYALAFSVLAEPSEHTSEYGGLIFEFDELLSNRTQQSSCKAFLDLLTALRSRNSAFWRHYTNGVFFDSLALFDPEEVVQFISDILENAIQLDDASSDSDSAFEELSDDNDGIAAAGASSSVDPPDNSDSVQDEDSADSEELDALDSRLAAFFSLRKKNMSLDKLKKNTALWTCMRAFDWLELATADSFRLALDYKLLIMRYIYSGRISGTFAQRMKSFVNSRYRFGKCAKSSLLPRLDEAGEKVVAHVSAFLDMFKALATIKPYAGHFFAFTIGLTSCDERLAAAKQTAVAMVVEQWHAYIGSTRGRSRLGAFFVELFANRPLIARLIVPETEGDSFTQAVHPFKQFEELRFWKICATVIPALEKPQKVHILHIISALAKPSFQQYAFKGRYRRETKKLFLFFKRTAKSMDFKFQ